MKKIFSVLLILALFCSFVSCSSKSPIGEDGKPEVDLPLLPNEGQPQAGDDMPPHSQEGPAFKENSFIRVEEQPTSTISSDADTASYVLLRKLVEQGLSFEELQRHCSGFRTEEFINYFDYDCPFPKEGHLFGHRFTLAPCPYNKDAALLMMQLRAKEATPSDKNNFVFLIDVSGSMYSDDKLPLLKSAFTVLAEQLDSNDTVSIVTYAGKESIVLDGCRGNDYGAIIGAIENLEAGGSTNGEGGIQAAYLLAEKHFIKDGNNRIFLASDGDFNVGLSGYEDLKELISQKRQKDLYFSAFGFGTYNYKDSNMEVLANAGNGAYYFIDSEKEARKIFKEDLTRTLYTVANDMKMQITFQEDTVLSYRLVGYENRVLQNEDFENDRKDAGEIGSGYTLTVCYELILKKSIEETAAPATLKIRYKLPGASVSTEEQLPLDDGTLEKEANSDFEFVSHVISFSLLLRNSPYMKEDITLETLFQKMKVQDAFTQEQSEFVNLLEKIV